MTDIFMKKWLKRFCTLLFAVVLLIAFIPPISPVQAAEKDDKGSSVIMVSLGDSYSSGEGIEPFYGQEKPVSEKVENQDWLAHRSKNSWSGMLTLPGVSGTMSQNRNTAWYFVASSGAKTKHLKSKQDDKEYDKDNGWWDDCEGVGEIDPQLDVFKQIPENETDYVTLTLGGNDADFEGIITTAAISTAYFNISGLSDKLNEKLEQLEEGGTIRKNLLEAYKDIADEAGPQAHIIVAGYPQLLDPNGGGLPFTKKEAGMINSAVSKFNVAIEGFVKLCREDGINIHFVPVEDAFSGHEAYSSDPYINKVLLSQQGEDLKDHDALGASAYSVHPNYKGACAYAECVQTKINQIENLKKTYKTEFKLSVYDYKGKPYDDYSVKIEGTSYSLIWGILGKEYSKKINVTSDDAVDIKLPKGKYTVTVSDGTYAYSSDITVKKSGKLDELVFNTYLGYDSTWDGGDDEWYSDPVRTTSDERDVVLVLDVSGSMNGTPLEETKKAASSFVETVLQQDASIGIVLYDGSAWQLADFSIDEDYLQYKIDNVRSGGSTNIDSGLTLANEMLSESTAKTKIIVLMSDGMPNCGREGDELIEYSDEIKNKNISIYTLGFFEALGGDKSGAQRLMEGIASDGCHYEVENAENLVFFFEDMADQINGTKYIYIRIACPVEVSVTHNGETLSSEESNLNKRTDFGTLTFEEIEGSTDEEDGRAKILRLKEGEKYNIEIVGTGRGWMDYTIGFMDEDGRYSDMREFRRIKITNRTAIDTVAAAGRSTVLKVDQDGDGKYDVHYRAKENGRGEKYNPYMVFYIIAALIVVAVVTVVIAVTARKTKKARSEIKLCSKCGAVLDRKAKFCDKCGTPRT